jgi:hypothetical protein
MTYEIIITNADDWLWKAEAVVKDDTNNIVLKGETTVSCETEQEAYDYTEKVFLSDLRANFSRQIGALVFPWEVQPEGEPV